MVYNSELDYGDALNFAQGHVSTLHISRHDVHAACVFFYPNCSCFTNHIFKFYPVALCPGGHIMSC